MPDLLVLVAMIPKLFGARVILNIHDMMPEMYMSKFGLSEKHPLIRILAMQEQFSIWLADKAICVHHPHRDVLVRRGTPPGKMTVLPNVPDPLVFRSENSSAPDGERIQNRLPRHDRKTSWTRSGGARHFKRPRKRVPGARLEIYGDGDAGERA